ncbi:MAG TPA: glycosyltransferase [Pirellulaceae bacterium]|nr:glycosyltransferase [Pirellulaceae bacterium]
MSNCTVNQVSGKGEASGGREPPDFPATVELATTPKAAAPAEASDCRVAVDASPLPAGQRWRVWQSLLRLRLKEWVTSDSRLCRLAVGLLSYLAAQALLLGGKTAAGYRLLFRLHRSDLFAPACRAAERALTGVGPDRPTKADAFLKEHVASLQPVPGTARFFEEPQRILKGAAIVIKSPNGREKGLIAINYNHLFPIFARHFDVPRIAERYHLLLEASWSGYCDPDILCFTQYGFPVFVEAYEPRDAAFLRTIGANLIPVATSTNWWVDHRRFRPLPGASKDFDLVMVAGWGDYKRHYRFFEALSRLRRQGKRPSVLLLGYSVGWKKETVLDQARYFGIADQLEVNEGVPYEQVNQMVNRAKVHVLWSRKEGVNRAIIECMFAGLPSIVREGFNYGYRYPYVNEQTGCFASEETLPRAIEEMVERSGQMQPREWVLENMSCQRSTHIVSETIRQWSAAHGEPWTEPPVVKTTHLHNMAYWNPDDGERFADDYLFLGSALQR